MLPRSRSLVGPEAVAVAAWVALVLIATVCDASHLRVCAAVFRVAREPPPHDMGDETQRGGCSRSMEV